MTDKHTPDEEGRTHEIKLTAGGEPIPIDLETGEIDIDKLTDEQRAELLEASRILREAVKRAIAPVTDFSAAIKEITSSIVTDETRDLLRALFDDLQAVKDLIDELQELEPYIKAELQKPEYEGRTFDDLMNHTPSELLELLQDKDSYFYRAIRAARAARDATIHTTVKRADIVEYPLDKPNSFIWSLLEEDTKGQITFNMLPKKPDRQATAIYSINFENLGTDVKITKRLTPFDKRVYIAVSALFNAGNDIVTLSQIYYAMGNTGRPAAHQLEKINNALTKMTGAQILFDNEEEAETIKGYPHFKYDGSLLPIERITAIINGQLSEGAVKVFREPPMTTFAKQRGQVTTIDVKLLQSPVSKTDANLSIDDYLIERISKAKNSKQNSCKVLYKTLYERANIKTAKQKQRAPEKIEKYLGYYKQQGFISKYSMSADGITILF